MSWERFKKFFLVSTDLGFSLDISKMGFPEGFLEAMEPRLRKAYEAMEELEKGSIANPDENRRVGHYWLRKPELAPEGGIRKAIETTREEIENFALRVHGGELEGEKGPFENLLLIGIGGSALGPQFVSQALGHPGKDKMKAYFIDNTDPDGIDLVLSRLEGELGKTLVLVISKSGSTPETRNGMVEMEKAYEKAGLSFARHAVAITGPDSILDRRAASLGWLTQFPMWDWVGGRTSETGPVGLLPAALQGFDIGNLLEGAARMDERTRGRETRKNPAALLALMWFYATEGRGARDMVILPYKDRLALFSKYLQQLIMESLGKEKDLSGKVVHQGIAVYGNKGSTDQHAYVQQLREGVPNFFVTFIEVLEDRETSSPPVSDGATAGDYLTGLLLGTQTALSEKGRESITLTIKAVTPFSIGLLIALYERAVGFYADLIHINAYHQPGVEAGKKAAASFLELNHEIQNYLKGKPGQTFTLRKLAEELPGKADPVILYKLLAHLEANPDRNIHCREHDLFYEREYYFKN